MLIITSDKEMIEVLKLKQFRKKKCRPSFEIPLNIHMGQQALKKLSFGLI